MKINWQLFFKLGFLLSIIFAGGVLFLIHDGEQATRFLLYAVIFKLLTVEDLIEKKDHD